MGFDLGRCGPLDALTAEEVGITEHEALRAADTHEDAVEMRRGHLSLTRIDHGSGELRGAADWAASFGFGIAGG